MSPSLHTVFSADAYLREGQFISEAQIIIIIIIIISIIIVIIMKRSLYFSLPQHFLLTDYFDRTDKVYISD
jgi:hypothetical protein